jgi:hypothetical protein
MVLAAILNTQKRAAKAAGKAPAVRGMTAGSPRVCVLGHLAPVDVTWGAPLHAVLRIIMLQHLLTPPDAPRVCMCCAGLWW